MKKIFSTLSLLAIVLLAGTSCSNDEIEINDSQLTFTINLSNVMKYDGVDIIEKYAGKMREKDKGLVKTFFKIFDEIEKLNNNKTYTETKNEC